MADDRVFTDCAETIDRGDRSHLRWSADEVGNLSSQYVVQSWLGFSGRLSCGGGREVFI
jgi:hypothetical protein